MQQVVSENRVGASIADAISIRSTEEEREVAKVRAWLNLRVNRARGIWSETVTVSPLMAAEILRRNPSNRTVRRTLITQIKADLEAGRYVLNGETIILSEDGSLNDGQHRLMAVVESGVPMQTVMVFGAQRNSRLTVDQGTARTTADYLGMAGQEKEAKDIATVARFIWQWETYGMVRQNFGSGPRSVRAPTRTEVVGVANDHAREIARSLSALSSTGVRIGGSRAFLAFCHWLLAQRDLDGANYFIARLTQGGDMTADHPINMLRNRLIREGGMKVEDRLEAILRAWNHMRRGERPAKLQLMGRLPQQIAA